jgi:hypothetical protein
MSFQTRTITYSYAALSLGILIFMLIIVSIAQQWKPEQFAGVISATVTGGSIAFLVMDKVLFDKPNFQIFVDEKIREELLSTKDSKEKSLAIVIRNSGFRDAYSVRTNISILSRDFKMQNHIPSNKTQMIKIGEEREWLVPVSVVRHSTDRANNGGGWIRVEVLSALSARYYFFKYTIDENEITVIDIRKFLSSIKPIMVVFNIHLIELAYDSLMQFMYEIRYLVKNKRINRAARITIRLDQTE